MKHKKVCIVLTAACVANRSHFIYLISVASLLALFKGLALICTCVSFLYSDKHQENHFTLFLNVNCLKFCNAGRSRKWSKCIHSAIMFGNFCVVPVNLHCVVMPVLLCSGKSSKNVLVRKPKNCLENVCVNCIGLKEKYVVGVNMPLNEMSDKQSFTVLWC